MRGPDLSYIVGTHVKVGNEMSERLHIPVPFVIEQTGRYERSYDIYSRLLKDRIIFLGTPIDDTVANLIVAQMLLLEAEDAERDLYL